MHQSFSSLRVLRASVRDPLNALCRSHRDAKNDVLRIPCIPWAAISEFRFKLAVFNRLGVRQRLENAGPWGCMDGRANDLEKGFRFRLRLQIPKPASLQKLT